MVEDKHLVSDDEIAEALADLDGWEYVGARGLLRRVWHFEKFAPTMAFVRLLTEVMDRHNHHSDLKLESRTRTLTVEVTTHSENAVTRADLSFAAAVNGVDSGCATPPRHHLPEG